MIFPKAWSRKPATPAKRADAGPGGPTGPRGHVEGLDGLVLRGWAWSGDAGEEQLQLRCNQQVFEVSASASGA